MTDPQIAEIAAKLTAAQREALQTKPRACDVWGNPERYCVVLRTGTLNALYGKGLIALGGSDTRVGLTDLGLAVAAYLKEQSK